MTNAELAVLGLVAEQPRHGYQVEQVIAERGMREWTEIGFSSIYYLLRKLAGMGLIISSLVQSGHGPARKVYRATEEGGVALRQELLKVLSMPEPSLSGLQLGLANLPLLSRDDALGALGRYALALEERRWVLDAKRRGQAPLPQHVEAMFEHSSLLIDAEPGWVRTFLGEMRQVSQEIAKDTQEQPTRVDVPKEEIMARVDYKRELKHLYNPSRKTFSIVDVPEMTFLMIDGSGDPNTSEEYQQALAALYAVAYGLKFALKAEGPDYVVPPLEGLWWTPDMAQFSLDAKDEWHWTTMIMQPEAVTPALFEQVRTNTARKKSPPALDRLRLATYLEGLSVQILYVGPYDEEAPTIAAMHAHSKDQGYELAGKHHEIYLSDPRRTAPDRLKTVIRQPIRRVVA